MKKSIFQFVSNNNINENQTYKDNNISNNNALFRNTDNKNTTSSLFGNIKDKNLSMIYLEIIIPHIIII